MSGVLGAAGHQAGELVAAQLGGQRRWGPAQRALLVVMLVAVPVVFDTSVQPIFALPKFTVVVLGALALLALAVWEWAQSGSWPWRNGLEVPVLLFLGWTALSAAVSQDPSQSVFGSRESLSGLVTVTAFVVVFFAAAAAFDASSSRRALAVLWFAGGGVVVLYGAVQLRDRMVGGGWDPVPWMNGPTKGAIWSTLGNPNDLAGFLAIILPVGLALLATGHSLFARAGSALMVTLVLVQLAVTTSRGALLAAVVAVVALVGWSGRAIARRDRIFVITGVTVLGVILGVIVAVVGVRDHGGNHDLTRTDEGTTVALRFELWRTAWRIAEDNPVAGVGPDGFGSAFEVRKSARFVETYGPLLLATDAHNLFLTILATSGFPALLAFACIVGTALLCTWTGARASGASTDAEGLPVAADRRVLRAALGAAMLAYLVQASFNRQDIALDFCFWFVLGLSCALWERERLRYTARRGRTRAKMATSAATPATASATQEMTPSVPSAGSAPAATSLMSLHHSWRSVSADPLIVRSTAQPRAEPGVNVPEPCAAIRVTHSWMSPRHTPSLRPSPRVPPWVRFPCTSQFSPGSHAMGPVMET